MGRNKRRGTNVLEDNLVDYLDEFVKLVGSERQAKSATTLAVKQEQTENYLKLKAHLLQHRDRFFPRDVDTEKFCILIGDSKLQNAWQNACAIPFADFQDACAGCQHGCHDVMFVCSSSWLLVAFASWPQP